MSVTLTDLQQWINDAMKKMDIIEYKFELGEKTADAEGYIGEVTFVKVIAKDKELHLVVKSAKTSEEMRRQTPLKEAYNREMDMYDKILPAFQQFQKECGVKVSFNKIAKCYSVCRQDRKEALVMENLKIDGFEIHDQYLTQNLNHALLVMRSYAEFHAISIAIRRKIPSLFASLTENMTDIMGQFITQTKILPNVTTNVVRILEMLRNNSKAYLADKLEDVQDHVEEYLTNFGEANNPHSVLLHGDCWNSNMMFKYEGNNKNHPIDIRFLDFQISRVGSPILDLSYYLYTVANNSILNHFDFLLQTYHNRFLDSLKEMGFHSDGVITFKELRQQWSKYGRYGLTLAPFILKVVLKRENKVDFGDSADKGETFADALDYDPLEDDEYRRRMTDVYTHFAEKFL